MKFIEQSEKSQLNEITDGQLSCVYQDIHQYFQKIRAFFEQKNISPDDTVVLESGNSLPGALTLLYLLEEGRSFLLIPGQTTVDNSNNFQEYFPLFCKYKIRAGYTGSEHYADFCPDKLLHVSVNEKYSGRHRNMHPDPKLYLRTSGSTGSPKMAVHSHVRLKKNAQNCVKRLGLHSDSRIAIPVPVAHMFGLGAAFLPAVAVGASVDLQAGANLLRYLQREREFNPDTAFMTPVFCETLVKGRRTSRPYRLTVTAGDRFRGEDTFSRYESLFGCLINLYGSTEMGAMSAACPDDPPDMRSRTAGRPMDGVKMRLEKQKDENSDEIPGTGILWCRHSYGFEGYIDEEGKSTGQFAKEQDGWFCTGDLGKIREDACIEVLGRKDHSVNRDGLLLYFADVENAVKGIDGIEAVAVMSGGKSIRGEKISAFCVPVRGSGISESQVRTSCFDIMPRRAVPDEIIFLKSFPMLPSGKIDRQKLSEMVSGQIHNESD
ncbi:MAG: AMP-binding protein [Desulfococcaceae bacterium]|jgi:acyl-coenzyme A synthetase/AMP-(fatty) acid ligase|nr:AMP-binding protein [Desulfococcaceae bacterium]